MSAELKNKDVEKILHKTQICSNDRDLIHSVIKEPTQVRYVTSPADTKYLKELQDKDSRVSGWLSMPMQFEPEELKKS